MRLKLASATVLGLVIRLASLTSGMQPANVARADGPIGGVDPVSGSLLQTFNFGYAGFQPYTQLTLSFLAPGANAFMVIDTPVPVITDGSGQAYLPINIVALLGSYPSALDAFGPGLGQLIGFAGLVTITWGTQPPGAIGAFRYDACDTLNCVDLVGYINVPQ